MPKQNSREVKLTDPRKIYAFTVFTALTGITPLDYYETENSISFLIDLTDARKFRQLGLGAIRSISSELKKQIEVIFYSNNLEKFVQNLFRPARIENIIRRQIKDGRLSILVKVPVWERGKALGKNSYKLYRARYFLSKYFDIDHVKII